MSEHAGDPPTAASVVEQITAARAWEVLLDMADRDRIGLRDEPAADLVRVVQRSGDARYVDAALSLLGGGTPAHRRLAARTLGQFGYLEGRPFGARTAPALAAAARQETDDPTRVSLVDALGSAEDPAWVPELSSHAADPYPPVRVAVAGSLPLMFTGGPLDDAAVATLIALTTDDDPDVRDWATTALGSLSDSDTPEIREALVARLDDPGADTAFEAALGLARRGDARVRDVLVRRLSADDQGVYLLDLEAAAALADPVLLPHLLRLQVEWTGEDDDQHLRTLRAAIARSSPEAAVRAAELEARMLAALETRLATTGWRVVLGGRYPSTSITFLRPDGTTDPPPHGSVWEDLAPDDFDPDMQAEHWESEFTRHTGVQ